MARGEIASGRAVARAHYQRPRLLNWLGFRVGAWHLKELSREIESVLGPQALEQGREFVGIGVALIVLALRHSEHADLGLVPSGDDVQREASARDVIDGRDFFGR